MLYTTVRRAERYGAFCDDFAKVLDALGGDSHGRDNPVSLEVVLDVAGLDAATWTLQCLSPGQAADRDRIARLFAADCAEMVLGLFERERPDDARPREAIAMTRRRAAGEVSAEDLAAAESAAESAAASVERDAAAAAAVAAAWAAQGSASRAAWSAAKAAVAASAVAGAPAEAGLTRRFRDYLLATGDRGV